MLAIHRHTAGLGEILFKTGGGHVRQVVGVGLLGQHVLLSTRHSDVEGFVHGEGSCRIFDCYQSSSRSRASFFGNEIGKHQE
jgi:hypothetical protein